MVRMLRVVFRGGTSLDRFKASFPDIDRYIKNVD